MDERDILRITNAIRQGASKVLPGHLTSRTYLSTDAATGKSVYAETQILEDIVQSVWVNLLETDRVNTKDANIEGRNHARDWMRKELKTLPLSQMDLKTVDDEVDSGEEIAPWDESNPSCLEQVSDSVLNTLEQFEKEDRDLVFSQLSQADRKFLARYINKKTKHTAKQWKRFQRLTESVKKLLNK